MLRKLLLARAARRLIRATPRVAERARIDAELDTLFDELTLLTALRRAGPDVDESVAHARARIEEWTA